MVKVFIGLFNFVKYGYNWVDVGVLEGLFVGLGVKFGICKFYNIVQLGLCWDSVECEVDGQIVSVVYMIWGFGYGFGVVLCLGKKSLFNMEVVVMYINEMEVWIIELNLLGQF